MRGIEALVRDSEAQKSPTLDKPTDGVSMEDLMTRVSDIMNILTEMNMTKDDKYKQEIELETVNDVPPVEEEKPTESEGE